MIALFEGIVLGEVVTLPSDPKYSTISVFLEEPQVVVDALINRVHGLQQLHIKGAKVLVYRTYNNQARIVTVLDDLPVNSPIWKDNTSASAYFQPGEVAVRASGDPTSNIPQDGGLLWCQNSGGVSLYSGSMTQKLCISDSTQSVSLSGSNLSLATNTSAVATQAFTLSTNLVGLSHSHWGIQNPITGLFLNGISIGAAGTINLGTEDPLSGFLTEGISITTSPDPFAGIFLQSLGSIDLTALQISLMGPTHILGATSITGTFDVIGATSILGPTSVTGAFNVEGVTSILGPTSVTGVLNVTGVYSLAGIPGISGTFPIVIGGAIVVAGGLVIAVIP